MPPLPPPLPTPVCTILYCTTPYYTLVYCTILYCTTPYYTLVYCTILYTILYSSVLYYTVLHYTILYSSVLYYTVLHYTILYSSVLYYTVLHYTILYSSVLYYTVLHYTILYSSVLYYTVLHYTILYSSVLYYTVLHYTVLYYTVLYYTVPEGQWQWFAGWAADEEGAVLGYCRQDQLGSLSRAVRVEPPEHTYKYCYLPTYVLPWFIYSSTQTNHLLSPKVRTALVDIFIYINKSPVISQRTYCPGLYIHLHKQITCYLPTYVLPWFINSST